jgi:hypothetical protein
LFIPDAIFCLANLKSKTFAAAGTAAGSAIY